MSLRDLLTKKKIIIYVNPNGVGKTTTTATIAFHTTKNDHHTIICTIDPTHQLANTLGLPALNHAKRRVPAEKLGAVTQSGGELWAMMLDQKHTFDEVVARHARNPQMAERIFGNRIYQQISSTLTNSLKYATMAKLQALNQ